MTLITRAALLAGLASLPLAGPALAASTTQRVRFPRGTMGTILRGRVRGYDTADYLLGARAGQQMSVSLRSDNTYNYFTITAPGAADALFHGDQEGGDAQFTTPRNGDYRIRVFLMRNAARRGEVGNFALEVSIQ